MITSCHATDETGLFNQVTIGVDALVAHGEHDGDIISAPEGGCPIAGGAGEGAERPAPVSDGVGCHPRRSAAVMPVASTAA